MTESTTLKYSCALCGIKRVDLAVRARATDQDVRAWMDQVVHAVAFDRRRRSPTCPAKEITELMIPVTGRDYVGGPVVN